MEEHSMSAVNIGVIGYGYWGPNLVRNVAELPGGNLVAVSDMREDRLKQVKTMYPSVAVTTNYQDLFAVGLDAVIIATPPHTHFAVAKDCMEHGLHCLVEKPITLNSQDAEALVKIAEERGLALMVGNTFEYNSAVEMLKQMVDSGDLGEVFYINAVRTNLGLFSTKLNVMWDLAPHDLSILLYLLGKEPHSVAANGRSSIYKGVEDIVYLNMKFENDVLGHVHVSWLDPQKVRQITVVGSKKMAVYDDMEPLEKIKVYDKGVETPPYTSTYAEFQFSYRHGNVVIPYIKFAEPLRVECQHFIDSIRNKTRPKSDGVVGLRIVRVLEAAEWSLRNNGQARDIEPFESLGATLPAANGKHI
jgi:predicted dehydrogenase